MQLNNKSNETLFLLNQDKATELAIQEYKLLDRYAPKSYKLFNGHSFCIEMHPDKNKYVSFLAEPYIKIGTGNNIRISTHVTRICLRRNVFVGHEEGKPGIVLNQDFLKDLNKAMKYEIFCEYDGKIHTVWKCINVFLSTKAKEKGYTFIDLKPIDFRQLTGYVYNPKDWRF